MNFASVLPMCGDEHPDDDHVWCFIPSGHQPPHESANGPRTWNQEDERLIREVLLRGRAPRKDADADIEKAARAIFESRGTGLDWDREDHCDEPTKRRYRDMAIAALEAVNMRRAE